MSSLTPFGQICILKHLLGVLDGVEGEREPECILVVGPGRDERRMTYVGWQLHRSWRAVSVFERYLGQQTSRSSFRWAIEMLECDSQG